MISPNYHHLFYFWTTAKTGRIGAAARTLYLAQPTLSLQIQSLERELGARLFDRGRKGVTLTPEGRVAFDYCERIFSQGVELLSALRHGAGTVSPLLRVGAAGSVTRHAVKRLAARCAASGVRLRVRVGGNAALKNDLARHDLDLLLADADLSLELGLEYRGRLCGQVSAEFVAAPKIAARVRRFPRDLAAVPVLLPAAEDPMRKETDLFLHRHGVGVRVQCEVEGAEVLRLLAAAGEGAAVLDALTARDDLATGRLKRLGRGASGISQQVWLIAGRHPKPNPLLRAAIEDLWTGFRLGS